jgi:putative endonuclease
MNNWYVYIAKTVSGQLYTGVSNNVADRIKKHNDGKGAKYTRANGPVTLVYVSESLTKSDALKREMQIKGWTRAKKLKLKMSIIDIR